MTDAPNNQTPQPNEPLRQTLIEIAGDRLSDETWPEAYWRVIEKAQEVLRLNPTPRANLPIDEFRRGIETAAASHDQIVTDLRNEPKSYKNGKILRSAKRASDFHERSAAAIRRLAEVRE